MSPELARILELAGVCERTLRNWQAGRYAPPPAVRVLSRIVMRGELVHAGPAWEGWHFRRDLLESPEGYTFEPLHIIRAHYWRAAAESALQARTAAVQFHLPGF